MRTSEQGIAFLEAHEGVVLKAYRDPVGVWTIGAGLTSASGVVKVRPGMVISRQEATRLLELALRRNYEPAVAAAMPRAKQHEFDAGVSFHWNTGAIGKAGWVRRWRSNAAPHLIRAGLMAWNKAGGRVLPGLTRRRAEEAAVLLEGTYPQPRTVASRPGNARWAVQLTRDEIRRVRDGFRVLGYDPGPDEDGVRTSAVIRFQADQDLKADNIIGRATLATLERALAARAKAGTAGTVTAASGGAVALPEGVLNDVPVVADAQWLLWVPLGICALSAVALAWSYRDQIAAVVQFRLPRLAALLRRF
ncbi:glycoside hydrolase family protein [Tabrizicola flagellatus]|uniref:glycoside hydrolase family protein n=1 Tax=Tabrizicola flagellatus TaxID=2593021 RepID=UPI0011F0BBF7|nr:glycoside hydrolase family protein [Tabrizicola flagellatus]